MPANVQLRSNLGRFTSDPTNFVGRGSIKGEVAGETLGWMTGRAADATFHGVTIAMTEAVEGALRQANIAVMESLDLFAKSLRNKTRRGRDKRIIRINTIAGQRAQAATVRAFRSRHPATPRAISRSRRRYADGALARALGSPGMVLAGWDGVAFVNRAILDISAKQWYRLNFGAGLRGTAETRPSQIFDIEFFQTQVMKVSLRANKPSPTFMIPAGAWFNRGRATLANTGFGPGINGAFDRFGGAASSLRGRDEFLAGGINSDLILAASRLMPPGGRFIPSKRQVSLGIRGTNYLDAGVRVLARELSAGWTVLMSEWFIEAAQSGKGPVARTVALDRSNVDIVRALAEMTEATGDMQARFARFASVYK